MVPVTGRRDFLRCTVRYGVLGTLVGLATWSMARNRRNCVNQGFCAGCPVFVDCDLPTARSTREKRPEG
jgi:hypothetical protein